VTTMPMQPSGPLLTEVLAWCAEHPWDGDDLTPGALTFQWHYSEADNSRAVSVMGAPPELAAFDIGLLDNADQELVTFERGLLVLNVQPERVLYEPLYVSRRAEFVMFRHVCSRCHNSRKVPDWTNWNEEYGEPRPKPCPDCAVPL